MVLLVMSIHRLYISTSSEEALWPSINKENKMEKLTLQDLTTEELDYLYGESFLEEIDYTEVNEEENQLG